MTALARSERGSQAQWALTVGAVASLALVPGLERVLWLALVGTTSQVLFGYCPMARLLDLVPWNRQEPLSWRLVVEVATRPPCGEGLLTASLAPSPR